MTDWRMALGQRKSRPAMIDRLSAAAQNNLYESCSKFNHKDGRGLNWKTRKARRRISTPNKSRLGIILPSPVRSKLLRLPLIHIPHHNHGGFTSNAAAGLPEIFVQDSRGHSASDQPPIHLDRLLATSQARPFPFQYPRTIPVTNPCPPSASKWYALQLT